MATLFYSVMGEGRGHAVRARAMAEHLRQEHRVVIYTSYDAYAFLREHYDGTGNVEVRETAGLKFHYTRGRMDLAKTVTSGLAFRWNLEGQLRALAEDFQRERPQLVVTDFEPAVPRAAHRCGVPVMSLDHQHFLLAYDLSSLPRRLRAYAALLRPFIRLIAGGQEKTVVSAFYSPPLRRGYEHVVQVGPLLRPIVRQTQPTVGQHILCYLRRATPPRVVDMLVGLDRPMRVYGLGERPPQASLTFCAVNEERFVEDLASATAVIAAAGNQLLGEAMYFGKPFLALPEAKHHEQCINAHFLQEMGGGEAVVIEKLAPHDLQQFLGRLEEYRERIAGSEVSFDGTPRALREIETMLERGA